VLAPSVTTLLLDARGGSAEALNRLLAQCGPRLLSLIRLRMGPGLRGRMESGDLLNATLLRAFRSFDSLEAEHTPSLMAWLSRIAESEIRDQVDRARAQRRDAALELPLNTGAASLAAELRSQTSRLLLSERSRRLEAAIEQLPEDQREIVLLRKYEELGFREIGERMGRSPDACRMLLARAMTALTLRMREQE
jgi:RNA polymerase sigma-70 factor (ECF subfamily)